MHRICLLLALFVLLPFAGRAEDSSYEMHEWGVFPVPRNAAWANIDMRGEISSMPKFFWKMWPEQHLPWRGPVKKPVIYFYADKPLSVDLTIHFADGRPLVWWPAAQTPAGGLRDGRIDELHFNLRVGHFAPPGSWQYQNLQRCNEQQRAAIEQRNKDLKYAVVDKGHWVEMLRIPNAAVLYTDAGTDPRMEDGLEKIEKFVYYDGIMKAPETPGVARDGDALIMKSNFAYAISDLMIVDRSATRTRLSKTWTNVSAGEQTTRVDTIAAGDGKGDAAAIAKLAEEFVKHLVAAGLTQDEAAGLEKVWHEGLFLRDGLSVVYRVPQETYDQWLPLTTKPAPKKIVRVGLVFHERMEPELDANVNALIKKLSAEEFVDRQAAMQALTKLGGAAYPFLEAAMKSKEVDAETHSSCRLIIQALDARPALQLK